MQRQWSQRTVKAGVVTLCLLFVVSMYLGTHSCDNSDKLLQLLKNIQTVFAEHDVPWLLEGGSLLGAVRDGSMIPHEFDNDINIWKGDLDRVLALHDEFASRFGYTLYAADDYIFVKALLNIYYFEWNPHLTLVCARIYDKNLWLYTDIYCDQIIQPSELNEVLEKIDRPPPAKDIKYAWTGGDDMGALRRYSDVYPSKMLQFADVIMPVPKNPEAVLLRQYGETWRSPQPKGVKVFFCSRAMRTVYSLSWLVQLGIVGLLCGFCVHSMGWLPRGTSFRGTQSI